ncbi:signal recognition particle-docking protein FtsY [Sodalis-like secondary symbiont of Drepanosiphum platanoidis]|uniref:signal recognition particle-docking protein FtsY n=1 Tax=Sodalis-like secondary symbiont of Drepanosiphum platanoidis TaxID=2994493 RepID=UPI00346467CB
MNKNNKKSFLSWFNIKNIKKNKNNIFNKFNKISYIKKIKKNKKKIKSNVNILSQINDTKILKKKSLLNNLNIKKNISFKEKCKISSKKFFNNLKNSLYKTRKQIGNNFFKLLNKKKIDKKLFEKIEEKLIISDIGIKTSKKIIKNLIKNIDYKNINNSNIIYSEIKKELFSIIRNSDVSLKINSYKPFIILVVGVNGVGKTTTIGKLAYFYKKQNKKVMLVAGDTFRAAAIDQLKIFGIYNDVSVIYDKNKKDSASIIFNSINIAKSKNIDILIIDTAGRLHNKINFMNELKKIVKVIKKIINEAPYEIMLILDASTGQNAINQTNIFNKNINITGITITKLDGTAKGGIIFSIYDKFNIPIRFIGIGEKIQDLRIFNSKDFIEAILYIDK